MAKLFSRTDTLKEFTKFPAGADLTNIEPSFKQVQNKIIKKLIGKTTLDKVLAEAEVPDTHTDVAELVPYVQGAVATHGVYLSVPSMSLQFSNGNLSIASTEDYAPAPRWRIRDYQISLLRDSGYYFDQLLEHLDENEDNYPDYLASSERLAWKNTFIYSPESANQFISRRINYYLLLNMQPIIKRIARDCIKPILGTALYNELLGFNTARRDWAAYAPLEEYIQEAIINYAMDKAMVELRLSVDDEGVGIIYGRVDKEDNTKDSNEIALFQAREQWKEAGDNAISLLNAELNENSDNYPLYTAPTYEDGISSAASVSADFMTF